MPQDPATESNEPAMIAVPDKNSGVLAYVWNEDLAALITGLLSTAQQLSDLHGGDLDAAERTLTRNYLETVEDYMDLIRSAAQITATVRAN
jgi:hypothetical protein